MTGIFERFLLLLAQNRNNYTCPFPRKTADTTTSAPLSFFTTTSSMSTPTPLSPRTTLLPIFVLRRSPAGGSEPPFRFPVFFFSLMVTAAAAHCRSLCLALWGFSLDTFPLSSGLCRRQSSTPHCHAAPFFCRSVVVDHPLSKIVKDYSLYSRAVRSSLGTHPPSDAVPEGCTLPPKCSFPPEPSRRASFHVYLSPMDNFCLLFLQSLRDYGYKSFPRQLPSPVKCHPTPSF